MRTAGLTGGVVLALLLLNVSGLGAQPPAVDATALVTSLETAATQLGEGQNPWALEGQGPQPQQLQELQAALPGADLWAAFKPVDTALRAAYRNQRRLYCDKDAGLLERRAAFYGVDTLEQVFSRETLVRYSHGRRQLSQVRNAADHKEFHAALCALWHFAAATGLWDRQAALEAAAKHLALIQARCGRRATLTAREGPVYQKTLNTLRLLVAEAMMWKPTPLSDETNSEQAICNGRTIMLQDWDALNTQVPVGSYRKYVSAKNPPLYQEKHPYIRWTNMPAAYPVYPPSCTHCTNPEGPDKGRHQVPGCVLEYRQWQYELGETQYGWRVNTHSGGWQDPGCDWRQYQPQGTWPAARGADNAGGL